MISQNPETHPHHHLGEAETLAIITRRQLHGIFVTDDRSARMLATKHNVRTASTWDLLRLATRVGLVDGNTVWGYIQTLGSLGRGQPPGVHDRPSYESWIE
jgi:predicted nucleic acid-binding protein